MQRLTEVSTIGVAFFLRLGAVFFSKEGLEKLSSNGSSTAGKRGARADGPASSQVKEMENSREASSKAMLHDLLEQIRGKAGQIFIHLGT